MKKTGHYVWRGTIELVSGTRIGGSDDVLQIGGTDLTCIKDPVTGKPYIPGSSLKGKMRSCLEKDQDRVGRKRDEPCGCARPDCPICRLFGPHKNTTHELGPTRLIVRDAHLVEGFQNFEQKMESTIRRDTGAAQHPRTVERVPPGATFQLEIAVQVFDIDDSFTCSLFDGEISRGAEALLDLVDYALQLVQQTGIGSGVGKGYGQVKILLDDKPQEIKPTRRGLLRQADPSPTEGTAAP